MSGLYTGYRSGFEFGDEFANCASAMAPENAPHDVSGWVPIVWVQIASDRHGLLLISNNESMRFVRQYPDGRVA